MNNKRDTVKNKKILLEVLERHLGIVTSACKEVGLSRRVYYNYYNDDPEFKKSVDEINEICVDFGESQLFKKMKEGSERSIIFFMKYRGRKRGYTNAVELDHKSSEGLNINYIIPKDNNNDDDDDDDLDEDYDI